jgi:hypothetical protein
VKIRLSGIFFCAYLGVQVLYPSLAWVSPWFDNFTWGMFAARSENPRFTVVFENGTRRDVGRPLQPGNPVIVFSAAVDQQRFLPPWLCAHWAGAIEVRALYARSGRREVMRCPVGTP